MSGTAAPVARLLEVTDLRTYFHTRDGVVKAVDGVGFTLDAGETLGVVGESGSGKSVMAMSLMKLVPAPPGRYEGGSIRLKGVDVLAMSEDEVRLVRGNRISMVFQDPMTSLNPVFRIGGQIAEPLMLHAGLSKKEAQRRAVELLDLVGVPNPAQRARDYPHSWSGGMRQRAMIAMALACDPDVLIADEPTTALDVTIQAQVLDLLKRLQESRDTGIVLITHDLGVVAEMADKVLVMYGGKPVEHGAAEDVFRRPLHPYTWGLMDSLPRCDFAERGELRPIRGQPPSLVDVPPGCAFHPRCPHAWTVCRSESPRLRDVSGGHRAACHRSGRPGFVRGRPVESDGEVA